MLIQISTGFAMEVAITVDDLPANGDLPSNLTRMEVAKKILTVFRKHRIKGVYGFINGNKISDSEGISILKEWVKAGHFLGNHTFHHLDLAKTDSINYIKDIKFNEPILSHTMIDKDYRYFRYPFLAEGNTQQKRDAIRQYLF